MNGPYSSDTHNTFRFLSTTMASGSSPARLKTALLAGSYFNASVTGTSAELPSVPTGSGKPVAFVLAATLIVVPGDNTAPDFPIETTPKVGAKLGDGKILLPEVPVAVGTTGPSPFGPRSVKP